MVGEIDVMIKVVEKDSDRSLSGFMDWDGCRSQAARRIVKKSIVRPRTLSEVERIGLLRIATGMTVVSLLVD